MAHHSYFEYAITRPYPFRWFTPVVIGGGIFLTGFFTFLTIAAGGYRLQNYTTLNPNSTLEKHPWFTKAPFAWRNSIRTACPPVNFVTGTSFVTSNLGFTYNLDSTAKIYNPEAMRVMASVPYTNQILQECSILDIAINFDKVDNSRDGSGYWWSWDISTRARAQCKVPTEEGDWNIIISTQIAPGGIAEFAYLTMTDIELSTSIWWGSRLINTGWNAVLNALAYMSFTSDSTDTFWTRGSMHFAKGNSDDIKSEAFFNWQYFFIASNGWLVNEKTPGLYNNGSDQRSLIITQGFNYARIIYHAMLVDLGQAEPTNLLLDRTLLRWALDTPDDVFRNDPNNKLNCTTEACSPPRAAYRGYNFMAGLSNAKDLWPGSNNETGYDERVALKSAYERYTPGTPGFGNLGAEPATIRTQYTCSVPIMKDNGSLFLLVLLALLVYLRTAWSLLTTIVKPIVIKKNLEETNACIEQIVAADIACENRQQMSPITMTKSFNKKSLRAASTIHIG